MSQTADTTHAGTGGLGDGTKQLLRAYVDELRETILTDGRWHFRDLDDDVAAPVKRLLDTPAVVRVDDAEGGNTGRQPPGIYRLHDAAVAYLDQQAKLRTTPCPCDHGGLQNIGDGEYTCAYDRCDRRFEREELEGWA